MKKKSGLNAGVAVDTVFTLTLFVVFAIAVLLVMLTGAEVYKNAASATTETGNARIANAYIVSKLHHFDACAENQSVSVMNDGENTVLVLKEDYGGTAAATYIYCRGGYLCELFADASDPFDPTLGERLLEADSFEVKQDGELLYFTVDEESTMAVYVRTGKGGGV